MATKKGERLVWVNDLQRASDVIYEVLRFHLNHYNAKDRAQEPIVEDEDCDVRPVTRTGHVEIGAMASLLGEVMRLGQYCYKDPSGAATVLAEMGEVVLPLLEDRAEAVRDPVANFAITRAILTLRRIKRDCEITWLGVLAPPEAGMPIETPTASLESSQWIA